MEWEAKLDDQVSAPAEDAAAALEKTSAATKALEAQLRRLDVAQQRTARSKEVQQKAFNPEAYKRQVKAEQELAAAKEKALQELGQGLSQKEKDEAAEKAKAQADAERDKAKAEQDSAKAATKAEKDKEKAAERVRKKTEEQRAAVGGLTLAAKGAALGLLAAAGAGGAMNLAQVAIGYRGMAQLQMVAYKAQLNLRGLFKGVDSKPLVNSFSRLSDLLNVSTPTGRALSDVLTRGFNGIFKVVEAATPYIEGFFQGILLGGYKAENAWLRLRIAAVPVTSQLGELATRGTALKVVAYGAALGLGVLAVKATVAAAPFIALAAAITAVVVAAEQFSKLAGEWDTDVMLRSIGIGESDADRMNKQMDAEVAARAKGRAGTLPSTAVPAVAGGAGAARKSGEQIGQGVVEGILSSTPAVQAAGGQLAAAADRGVRMKAEIRSPARLFKREAHYMGEGAVEGLEESAPRVQQAAEKALVPDPMGHAGAGAGGQAPDSPPSAGLSMVNHFDFSGASFGGGTSSGSIEAAVERAVANVAQALMVRLGVT